MKFKLDDIVWVQSIQRNSSGLSSLTFAIVVHANPRFKEYHIKFITGIEKGSYWSAVDDDMILLERKGVEH